MSPGPTDLAELGLTLDSLKNNYEVLADAYVSWLVASPEQQDRMWDYFKSYGPLDIEELFK